MTNEAQHGGQLTTHVLDTTHGRPGAGIALTLYRVENEQRIWVLDARTNADGRCDVPLLAGDALKPGCYELVFKVGSYFRAAGLDLPDPPFLESVPIRFGVFSANQHYHVPLLVSPYGYSTYRGS
jgi:5-hydroxyisourate hydrolase